MIDPKEYAREAGRYLRPVLSSGACHAAVVTTPSNCRDLEATINAVPADVVVECHALLAP